MENEVKTDEAKTLLIKLVDKNIQGLINLLATLQQKLNIDISSTLNQFSHKIISSTYGKTFKVLFPSSQGHLSNLQDFLSSNFKSVDNLSNDIYPPVSISLWKEQFLYSTINNFFKAPRDSSVHPEKKIKLEIIF